jgi:TonB family protein
MAALRLVILIALATLLASVTSITSAQDASATADAAVPELVAPQLITGDAPHYPEGETTAAVVLLELTLDASGNVTASTITQSAGNAFDNAALAAAAQLKFSPAQKNGVAIPAVIPFSFELAPPEPAPIAAPPPPPPPAQPEPAPILGETNLTVRGAPPLREPTRHSLDLEEVRKVPGTGGDVLRAVETMPGVARPAWGEGLLIVRGAAPDDSLVFVDGTPIPYAYHLGDGASVIPGDVLERLDFYPGNFGPQFGRGMGGVIDVGLRSPRRDRFHGLAQVDIIDGRLMMETPLGENTGILIAARRSWVDAWIGGVLESTGTDVQAAPVYWDGQAIIEHDFSRRTRGRISFFGADDRFKLLIKSPDAADPSVSGTLGGYSRFLRTQARLETELSDTATWINTLSYGITDSSFQFGTGFFDWTAHDIAGRSDFRAKMTEHVTFLGGLDAQWSENIIDARFRPYPEDGAAEGPYFARPARSVEATATLMRPGAYAGLEIAPVPTVKLLPSIRSDYAHEAEDLTFDPRFSARWDIVSSPRRTTLKSGIGLYSQPPKLEHTADAVVSEVVKSSQAIHTSLGIEQELADGLEVSVEGFYKKLNDLIVARADESQLIGARFENSGSGRIYGAETLLRYKSARSWLSGFVAYTLSRSERRDSADAAFTTFEWDQTHILSMVGSADLGRGWTLGARFRFVTGTPFTPNAGSVLDLDAGAYAPIAAAQYSERMPDFHQLDLRIEKEWDFEAWKLAAYLEARNAYNHQSVEGVSYNYDYSERKDVEGLPILPVIGIRGEL